MTYTRAFPRDRLLVPLADVVGQDEHCRYMAALCMHARGQLDEAARSYDALLSLKPGHQAWYTRECCVYLWNNIRRAWREFSPDAELDPEFKVGLAFLVLFVVAPCVFRSDWPSHPTSQPSRDLL